MQPAIDRCARRIQAGLGDAAGPASNLPLRGRISANSTVPPGPGVEGENNWPVARKPLAHEAVCSAACPSGPAAARVCGARHRISRGDIVATTSPRGPAARENTMPADRQGRAPAGRGGHGLSFGQRREASRDTLHAQGLAEKGVSFAGWVDALSFEQAPIQHQRITKRSTPPGWVEMCGFICPDPGAVGFGRGAPLALAAGAAQGASAARSAILRVEGANRRRPRCALRILFSGRVLVPLGVVGIAAHPRGMRAKASKLRGR